MILKAINGVSSPNVGQLWNLSSAFSENVSAALDTTATHLGHYKNRIVMNWTTFNPQEVNLTEPNQAESSKFDDPLGVCFSALWNSCHLVNTRVLLS